MNGLASRANLPPVMTSAGDSSDRGAAIRRRIESLGIGDREWHRVTGIDRKTLDRAMNNNPGTRASTYDAIEVALGRLEAGSRGEPTTVRPVGNSEDDLVEFVVEGNFGVRAVVKGPIRDIDALQAAVAKLVADMGRDEGRS